MRIDWGWGGIGAVGVVGLILFLVFWGLVIAALILLIRWLVRSDQRTRYDGPPPWDRHTPPPGPMPPPGAAPPAGAGQAPFAAPPPVAGFGPVAGSALETLRQRYARGEIDEAEFERRRAFLEGGRGAGGTGDGDAGGTTTAG